MKGKIRILFCLIAITSLIGLSSCDRGGGHGDNATVTSAPAMPYSNATPQPASLKPPVDVNKLIVTVELRNIEKDYIIAALKEMPFSYSEEVIKEIERQTTEKADKYSLRITVETLDKILIALQERRYKDVAPLIQRLLDDGKKQVQATQPQGGGGGGTVEPVPIDTSPVKK